ncbi:MAG: DNA repair protein RecN, partial [Oscillospiraceae bacterium]|nr:DNA repair protein RecN [Oscillospiraceae bacterium]
DAARAELDGLENLEQTAARLDGEYRAQYAVTLSAAQELSAARQDAARRLEAAVDAEFGFLCMPGARFSVRLGARTRDGRTLLGNDGIDTVEFYLAANRGEDARPLARSASGGELSRVMLALCTVGGSGGPSADTMIFDEIDAGISGIAAGRVADRLARLAAERQILCVTHLSQIAAAADAHFAIRKEEENGRTLTRVSELDRGGRIAELARINAGEGFSEAIRAAAAEQLDDSARRKKGLSPHD